MQAYVDRVGQRVVAAAGVSGFRFVVLDSPVANAHAVESYVFVTRGLLALLENEAELAAAIGHELGHLVQRHAAQRARVRQGVLDALAFHGYRTLQAERGDRGLPLALTSAYDLLVLDLVLPGVDGLERDENGNTIYRFNSRCVFWSCAVMM